jgi:vacuolar-type H+-ATPase subunit I/STV1
MTRLTIAGLATDKDAVLESLQTLGFLHLIPLRPAPREPEKEPASHAGPAHPDRRARARRGAASLEAAELELKEIVAEHQALSRWIYLISSHLAQAEDQAQLRHARAQPRDEERLFLVQGWAPEDALAEVRALTEARGLALLVETPDPRTRHPPCSITPHPSPPDRIWLPSIRCRPMTPGPPRG